jgi:hypothetical protein
MVGYAMVTGVKLVDLATEGLAGNEGFRLSSTAVRPCTAQAVVSGLPGNAQSVNLGKR